MTEITQNLVPIPTKEAGPEEWSRFFNKLGRPADGSGYQLQNVQADFYDNELGEIFKKLAYQAGLNQQQAAILHDGMVAFLTQKKGEASSAIAAEEQNVTAQLQNKWGVNYAKKLQKAKMAAGYFAFSEDDIKQLESRVGSAAIVEAFARIGEDMAQDSVLMDVQPQTAILSPDAAKKKRNELSSDTQFLEALMDKAHPSHAAAVNELDQLNQIIVGSL